MKILPQCKLQQNGQLGIIVTVQEVILLVKAAIEAADELFKHSQKKNVKELEQLSLLWREIINRITT